MAGGLLVVAGLWAWWATQLWGLPDVGDPFDVAAFEAVSVPGERNAFVDYREAASMSSRTWRKFQASQTAKDLHTTPEGWAQANPTWRDFLAQSGETLATWRAGSEKPPMMRPPSTTRAWPVMNEESSDARKSAAVAISSGRPIRDRGAVCRK